MWSKKFQRTVITHSGRWLAEYLINGPTIFMTQEDCGFLVSENPTELSNMFEKCEVVEVRKSKLWESSKQPSRSSNWNQFVLALSNWKEN